MWSRASSQTAAPSHASSGFRSPTAAHGSPEGMMDMLERYIRNMTVTMIN